MSTYNTALNQLVFSGPTYFAPLLKETKKVAETHKLQNTGVYTILLILTDGEIHDMPETIETIHQLAFLPVSIIIVGVGNEQFSNMEILDGDEGLYNSKGQRCPRDLVQFVPFKKFQNNYAQLAREVLAEIPDQLVGYMKLIGLKPVKPQEIDISQLVPKIQTQPQQQFQGNVSMPVQAMAGDHFGMFVSAQSGQNMNVAPVNNQNMVLSPTMNVSENVGLGGNQYLMGNQGQQPMMFVPEVQANSVSINVNFDEHKQQSQQGQMIDPNQLYANIPMASSQQVNYSGGKQPSSK